MKYSIITRTGDRENADTDDNVYIIFGRIGQTRDAWLDTAERNDFERGHLDGFIFYTKPLARVSHFVLMAHGIKQVNLRKLF